MFKAIFSSSSSSKEQKSKSDSSSRPSSASSSKHKQSSSPSSSPTMDSLPLLPSRASSSTMAAWTIPPFPHPLPERRIGVLPTGQGLLVYPRSSTHVTGHRHHPTHHVKASTSAAPVANSSNRPYGSGDGFKVATIGASHAPSSSTSAAPVAVTGGLPTLTSLDVGFLIDWTKEAKITPLAPPAWSSLLDSASSDEPTLECSGIIGLSRFFSSSYLFVITDSKLIGHYFHDTRPIYCCTGVLAIPLLQQEATQAIRAQLAKQGDPPNQSAQSSSHKDDADVSDSKDQSSSESEGEAESSESDYDDVETPAAIPREPFFSSLPASQRSDTLRMPKSRPWLTRAARAVSDGRIETISEDANTQAKLADASVHDVDVTDEPEVIPIPDPVVDAEVNNTAVVAATPDEQWHAAKQAELEDKAVRETAKYWARGEFWFSYDFDLTTSLQNKRRALDKSVRSDSGAALRSMPRPLHPTPGSASDASDSTSLTHFPLLAEPYPNLPLWRRADRRFWHNEHMSKDFVHAGLHAYILPVMQGYLQTVNLPVRPQDGPEADTASIEAKDDEPVVRCQLMVISRRSKERAGLRYQRRGINEAGQVANFVETEQLVYVLRSRAGATSASEVVADALSFVQIRGSIPLYWSQSPFSLKPPPVLERTEAENIDASRKHFGVQVDRYGSITCINLAEQGGKEGAISKAYRAAAEKLRDEDVAEGSTKTWDRKQLHYVDFDFHKECSGMRFENVAKLIAQMEPTLAQMKYYHHRSVGAAKAEVEVLNTQTGVFRVSCLDCLDRTNVVQSAFARHVLTGQLAKLGIRVGEPASSSASAAEMAAE
ncbi:related to SAC1 - Phosphatidylinositol phosphate phosphatase [Moesziomyces antarcticus]|uniref:Related to SAC1 - Phosphatidylinositol phosphate phosphatase n=2 Tax=Pseudozyma antarctica TaxID=84753 RepID=A0A5C3FJH0_PSEA2|nr:related to SAC1 - Phosphatidylinositol phosphate phosphatase [Moesziomyces antarcticus]